ncbi:UNVERIFIED_CONTAM: hypothetical protein GTU68_035406 [Idotea baltica]|nr:hypothetical protein [Idotea baltica]
MSNDMSFLPRSEILSFDELYRVASVFVAHGVKKIRLTGGEPLVRKGVVSLCEKIAAIPGLDELVITTNGSQLKQLARPLLNSGIKRINVSLDTLCANKFKLLTRYGSLDGVLAGLQEAKDVGFHQIKLNSVILKGRNDLEVLDLLQFAITNEFDITFIEEMPLGDVGRLRKQNFYSSAQIRQEIERNYRLIDSTQTSGGPARYKHIEGYINTRIGFISPHSDNFCATCNRLRLTAEGRLLLCLGHENSVDLRKLLRCYPNDDQPLIDAVLGALACKPERHQFATDDSVQLLRFMNASGG